MANLLLAAGGRGVSVQEAVAPIVSLPIGTARRRILAGEYKVIRCPTTSRGVLF